MRLWNNQMAVETKLVCIQGVWCASAWTDDQATKLGGFQSPSKEEAEAKLLLFLGADGFQVKRPVMFGRCR
jgi:hypothetical protein